MFCSKCGCKLNDGVKFCVNCGNMVSGNSIDQNNFSNSVFHEKVIKGTFAPVQSKIPINIAYDEFLIEQVNVAIIESTIAEGLLTITNKRLLFNKDSAAASFVKGGGLLGMALRKAANVPSEISFNDIVKIEPTIYIKNKASFIITLRSGYSYKFALQSMKFGKANELIEKRDYIVGLIGSIL